MLLNLLNLYSLIFALFSKIDGMSKDLDSLKPLTLNATRFPNGTLNISENMALKTPSFCYEEEISCEICNTELMVPIILNNGITINTTAATPFSVVCTSSKINSTPKRLRRQREDNFNYIPPNDKDKNNSALTTNIQLGLEQLKIINQLIKLQPKNHTYEIDVNDTDDDEYSFYDDTETTSSSTDININYESYNYPSTTMDSAPKTVYTGDTYETENELITTEYYTDTTFSLDDNTDFTTGVMSYSDTKYILSTGPYEATTYKGDLVTEYQSESVKTEITTIDTGDQATASDMPRDMTTSYAEITEIDYEGIDITFSSQMTDFETTDKTRDFSYISSDAAMTNFEKSTDETTDSGSTDEIFNFEPTYKSIDSGTTVKAINSEVTDRTTLSDITHETINSKVTDKTTNADITITSIDNAKDYTTEISIIYATRNATSTTTTNYSTDIGLKSTSIDSTTSKPISPTVKGPKICSNMTCNCTVSCSGEVITQVFYISHCTVNKICYKRICDQGAEKKVNGENLEVDIAYVDENKIKRYNLTKPTKKKLLKLCWETMFGQELIKLTMMDLVRYKY